MDGQHTKWRRKTAENFNWLSRMHERYRQTTDRRTGDSIANSRSRSLKINKAYSVVGIIRPHCSTTYVDAAYCYRLSDCWSVTLVSPAKTAEPIEMPFGLWVRMGPRNLVLDGGPEVLRDVAMATNFWLSLDYNFGCIIASDTLF